MAKKLYYKIGEACKELDIQPYVLRYWETEFQALSPSKSKSGQRVYSAEDLELIGRIKELLYKEGYTIAGAKKKLDSESAPGPRAVEDPSPQNDESDDESDDEPEASADEAEAPQEAPKKEPAEAPKKPAAAATSKPKRVAKKKASRRPSASAQEKTVARLRQGIEDALREAKDILEILDRA